MGTFTVSTGLGMLGIGFLAIAIIGAIAFYIINNHVMREDKDDDGHY
jgi:hypothetical protein